MASFFVIRGQDHGRNYAIRGEITTIGRDPSNHIRLSDTEVSRQHAKVVRTAGAEFELQDSGSSNGSFVNSSQVQSIILHSGDRVQLGRTLMIFTAGPETRLDATEERSMLPSEEVEIVAGQPGEPSQIRSRVESQLSKLQTASLLPSEEPSSLKGNSSTGSLVLKRPIPDYSDGEIVYQVSQAIRRTIDIGELLEKVLDLIFQWIECDRGCVLLNDEITGGLRPACARHRTQDRSTRHRPLQISRSILDHVIQSQEGILTSNAQEDSRWDTAASIAGLGIREAICVPMLGRYGMQGAIYVDTEISAGNYAQQGAVQLFDDRHLKLLIAIAGQAALAIEDTQFYSAMLQSERLAAMGQTIADLSHHVKNILQGISGGSFLVEDGLNRQDLSVVSRGWAIVKKNQDRVSGLVMDMLSFSKDRQPDLQLAEVNRLVSDVVELVQVRAAELGVQLKVKLLASNRQVMMDSHGIQHALLNVVHNAVDAAASCELDRTEVASVQIEVHLDADTGMISISVEDNGEGIAEDQLPRIFAPFHSSKGARGTGLGLPVSQKIMREHGGDLEATSQVGYGSRFVLRWPAGLDANSKTNDSHETSESITE